LALELGLARLFFAASVSAEEECASAIAIASIFAPPPKQRQARMRWQRY